MERVLDTLEDMVAVAPRAHPVQVSVPVLDTRTCVRHLSRCVGHPRRWAAARDLFSREGERGRERGRRRDIPREREGERERGREKERERKREREPTPCRYRCLCWTRSGELDTLEDVLDTHAHEETHPVQVSVPVLDTR